MNYDNERKGIFMDKEPVLDYISLGLRIRQARRHCNMTQAELGEACSLSTSYIGHIERGSRTLSVETLYRIASVLGVSIDSLVSDSVPNTPSLFRTIETQLQYKDKRKTAQLMKIIKVLADNMDQL